ncbi:MAG: FecR domain-containing protein, partial [Rhodospirillaceae bacterium]|nr:FecR domain-containing protein [Rhodospirillaceae bacterium]
MASDNETTGQDNISLTDVTPFQDGDATEIAQAASGADAQPIGTVDTTSGSVVATRIDGTKVELEPGSPVYQGDVIETAGGGSIGVTLADETTFSMAENGNMVLDEMVYDPATQEGSVSISAVEGVFTFVSGQIAKTDPDAMTLDTPVATIGIRGTQVGLNVEAPEEGEGMTDNGDGTWTYAAPADFEGTLDLAYGLNNGAEGSLQVSLDSDAIVAQDGQIIINEAALVGEMQAAGELAAALDNID